MGGNASSGGLSNLFGGGGNQSFDPTTGTPLGSLGDPTGGVFWANPSNPGVTEQAPTQAAQNTQAGSYDPTTGQPTTSPTGSQSGPSTPSWVQNLSNIFLGGGSPTATAMQASATGGGGGPPAPGSEAGPGWVAPAPAPASPGWPTQAPGAAGAAVPGSAGGVNPYSQTGLPTASATVSPQSAPVSGKTQAVPEVAPAAPAPATAPAAAAPDTTNYPDVSGTSRESGMGPTGPTTINTGVSAAGTGIPPVLQDLFSLNFGRFISDLLGQQGMSPGQNQAATPRPSTDTGTDTADTGKTPQTPAQKATDAITAAGEALKPKPSGVDATPTTATPTPTAPGTAGTATAAPTTPAEAPPSAPAAGQLAPGATAPATAAGPTDTNLMGTGFFDPRTTQGRPAGAPTTARAAPAAAPAASIPTTAPATRPGATVANIPPNAGDTAVTRGQPPAAVVSGAAPPAGVGPFGVGQFPASDQWVSQQHIGLSRNGGSDTAPTAGYSSTMRDVRAARFSQMTPQDRILMYGMMQAENERDPIGPMESLANRSAASRLTMGQLLRSRFYGPGASFERRGRAIAANPRLREHYDSVIAAVQNGSNVLGGATDQGSGRDPNVGWQGGRVYRSGEVYNDWGGGRGHFGNAQWRHEVQARVQAEGRQNAGNVVGPGGEVTNIPSRQGIDPRYGVAGVVRG